MYLESTCLNDIVLILECLKKWEMLLHFKHRCTLSMQYAVKMFVLTLHLHLGLFLLKLV